jgi:hypothetical protein
MKPSGDNFEDAGIFGIHLRITEHMRVPVHCTPKYKFGLLNFLDQSGLII